MPKRKRINQDLQQEAATVCGFYGTKAGLAELSPAWVKKGAKSDSSGILAFYEKMCTVSQEYIDGKIDKPTLKAKSTQVRQQFGLQRKTQPSRLCCQLFLKTTQKATST